MRRGMTLGEWLIVIAVALVCAATMAFFYRRAASRSIDSVDIEQMRRVYVGFAMYQEDNQGRPPGSLAELHGDIDFEDLTSPADPFAGSAKMYPIEPALPEIREQVPYRISYAYLGNFLRAGRAKIKSWSEMTPNSGVLACQWHGRVSIGTTPFTANVDGPILRVLYDGSLFRLPQRRHPDRMGDFDDLFIQR